MIKPRGKYSVSQGFKNGNSNRAVFVVIYIMPETAIGDVGLTAKEQFASNVQIIHNSKNSATRAEIVTIFSKSIVFMLGLMI